MHPVIIILTVFVLCILCILIAEGISNHKFKKGLKHSEKETDKDLATIAAKKSFIKSTLGFDIYSYGTVSKAFNKLTEAYNTNVNAFVLYNHINSLQIPGGHLVEDALPVDTIYTLLKSVTRRQELLFLYR